MPHLSSYAKKKIKQILCPFYSFLNLFYFPLVKHFLFSKIDKLPPHTQLFFLNRFDFGTWILLMHYATCWQKKRGPVALVLFVSNTELAFRLAQKVCPDVKVIAFSNVVSRMLFSVFRTEIIQYSTLNKIYAFACCQWPSSLFIFDMIFSNDSPENVSRYIPLLDPVLQNPLPFSREFVKTYTYIRRKLDYRKDIFQDMTELSKEINFQKERKDNTQVENLLHTDQPYVVLNLNCKNYENRLRHHRRINHPERYDALIDFLISQGYAVVQQGRSEQPKFSPRKGLIEYYQFPAVSVEHDHTLFSSCSFAILPKTGPEAFGPACNIPILGLDYTELATMVPKYRCRFFPKHIWDRKRKEYVHWKELLQRPCFFNVGIELFEEDIEYVDLEEHELIQAAEEFLTLLPLPSSSWVEYSEAQKEFKRALHPIHIDLYTISEVPCETYLKSPKYAQSPCLASFS